MLWKINILLDFKWNYRLCGHVLTWQQIQVFCIRNISKRKQASARKHTEHCLTHLNKTACEIWSVSDKVLFCVKHLMPFFHRTLQLFYYTLNKKKMEVMFLLLHWRQASQSAQPWHDYHEKLCTSFIHDIIACDLEYPWHDKSAARWCHRCWFQKFTVCVQPIREEIVSSVTFIGVIQ